MNPLLLYNSNVLLITLPQFFSTTLNIEGIPSKSNHGSQRMPRRINTPRHPTALWTNPSIPNINDLGVAIVDDHEVQAQAPRLRISVELANEKDGDVSMIIRLTIIRLFH